VRDHQHQQRADAGRRQRRQDRQWQDVALIQDAKDDVHGEQRRRDQIGLAAERGLKRLRCPLECAAERGGRFHAVDGAVDRRHRVAERRVRRQVERQGHRRELTLMADRERLHRLRIDFDEG
jgi:hypothetical protein